MDRRRALMAVGGGSSMPDYSNYRGVYIEDVDGYLYTEYEWDGSKTANGIAVLTDNCRFVIALEVAHPYSQWGNPEYQIDGITTTYSESAAIVDYDGKWQTETILVSKNAGTNIDTKTAAYYCYYFTFPNGNYGYLGAAGEWKAVFYNKEAIYSAMEKLGTYFGHNNYWTSTQVDYGYSWNISMASGRMTIDHKTYKIAALPFTTLKWKSNGSPYTFSFNIEVSVGNSWIANAEQLVQINKMFAIVTKFIGMDGGEFNQDNAPQEFDLRINGVRSFTFYCGKVNNESDVVEIFITLSDGDGVWFNNKSFTWNNPITNSFTIYPA